jgi:hypothetical protein
MKSENSLVTSRNENVDSATQSYQKPAIRVLDEKDVLSAFQVTVAAATWWVM